MAQADKTSDSNDPITADFHQAFHALHHLLTRPSTYRVLGGGFWSRRLSAT
jgi:hypothetical protein